MTMSDDRIDKLLERVAQQIMFCNCATEGPALKRCEHVSLAAALEERLGPLLRAGQALCDGAIMPEGFENAEAWTRALAALEVRMGSNQPWHTCLKCSKRTKSIKTWCRKCLRPSREAKTAQRSGRGRVKKNG